MSKVTKNGNHITVRVDKDIVSSMAKEFRNELNELIEQDVNTLVIDLAEVELIDSVGLGVFIATHNGLGKTGGELKVINANPKLENLFKTMGLNRHFEITGLDLD